jgi:hypothetical protein
MPRHLKITQYRQEKEANIHISPILLGHIQGTKAKGEN